jgi:hypothetical protein
VKRLRRGAGYKILGNSELALMNHLHTEAITTLF